jgi:hypothetical protein
MPAPSKTFTALTDAEIAAGKLLTTEKMTKIRDALSHLEEWLGKDYTAAQNHNHDGVNSAAVEVGPNYVRNPSFEDGTVSWTTSAYTGGSIATNTANDLDGATALGITSTVLANGGGDAVTTGYFPVTGGRQYLVGAALKASTSGVSSKVSVIWYSDAQAQISETTVYSSSSTPTALQQVGDKVAAPATARYARVKLVGGVPATGTSVGTIWFDGVFLSLPFVAPVPGSSSCNIAASATHVGGTYTEKLNYYPMFAGKYTTRIGLRNGSGNNSFARVYVNGVAAGAERLTNSATEQIYTEDIDVPHNATVQVFLASGGGTTCDLTSFDFRVANPAMMLGTILSMPVGFRT